MSRRQVYAAESDRAACDPHSRRARVVSLAMASALTIALSVGVHSFGSGPSPTDPGGDAALGEDDPIIVAPQSGGRALQDEDDCSGANVAVRCTR